MGQKKIDADEKRLKMRNIMEVQRNFDYFYELFRSLKLATHLYFTIEPIAAKNAIIFIIDTGFRNDKKIKMIKRQTEKC